MPFAKSQLNLRFLGLSLAFALAVATGALGISALVNAMDEQDRLNKNIPEDPCRIFVLFPCTNVDININDLMITALIVGLSSGLVALTSLTFLLLGIFSQRYARSLKVPLYESITLALLSFLTLGALIPMTYFFATRSADVQVSIGDVPIPSALVDKMIDFLGETTEYDQINYLKPYIIVPWIEWFFICFASVSIYLNRRKGRWPIPARHVEDKDDRQNLRGVTRL